MAFKSALICKYRHKKCEHTQEEIIFIQTNFVFQAEAPQTAGAKYTARVQSYYAEILCP